MRRQKYQTKFPVARIKRLMQKDKNIGKVNMASPYLISKSLELFLSDFITLACTHVSGKGEKRILNSHMLEMVNEIQKLAFLKDLITKHVSLVNNNSHANGQSSFAGDIVSDQRVYPTKPEPMEGKKDPTALVDGNKKRGRKCKPSLESSGSNSHESPKKETLTSSKKAKDTLDEQLRLATMTDTIMIQRPESDTGSESTKVSTIGSSTSMLNLETLSSFHYNSALDNDDYDK